MERTQEQRPSGLTRNGVRTWGLLFVLIGVLGRSLIQRGMLGIGQISGQELLAVMGSSDEMMIFATIALICQVLETCAVPIFSFLLVDGFLHTSDEVKYLLRVGGVALLSEIPYNVAVSGKLLDFGSRNPVFGLLFAMIALMFYKKYPEKNTQHRMAKFLATVAAVVWALMLRIDTGFCIVIVAAILWGFQKNSLYQVLAGSSACMVCSLTSPLFMASPMGFLVVHFYNGEKGAENRLINYLAYPAMLLAAGVTAMFL